VSGYPDFINDLLSKSIQVLTSYNYYDLNQDWIDSYVEASGDYYKNQNITSPLSKAKNILSILFREKYWTDSDLLSSLEGDSKFGK